MALAVGTLTDVSNDRLVSMHQQEAEACCGDMTLLDLLVLSNAAHRSSRATVTTLQER